MSLFIFAPPPFRHDQITSRLSQGVTSQSIDFNSDFPGNFCPPLIKSGGGCFVWKLACYPVIFAVWPL